MDQLLSSIFFKIRYITDQRQRDLIEKAYNKALELHQGQLRKSGEPYIVHPVQVTLILADMQQDYCALCGALLHDTVEDTDYSLDDVREEYGETIAAIVDGVTKLSNIPYSSKEEQKMETFRKMFLAMAKDLRVMLIKLADRIHNMRTLQFQPPEKQKAIAVETLDIYAPLANRLGIQRFKSELEDLSLKYIDPEAYTHIVKAVSNQWSEREMFISQTIDQLRNELVLANIPAQIEGRQKHYYSIYRKMKMQNRSIDEIYDLVAFRVITDSIKNCYSVLGILHEMFTPVPGRFKDYIAMPKPNMYQSIHNTLVGGDGLPFEVQIRTWDMHRVAQEGIAAHWKYKENFKGNDAEMDKQINWIRQMVEWQQDTVVDPDDFVQSMKTDMFSDEVYVFTPNGDPISLPVGSTPIDFAYAIHSAVGNKMMGAKVNGRIMPINYTLKNGDQVEIITTNNGNGPSRDWLKIVKSSQARSKINQWFKKEKRDENIATGKVQFDAEVRRTDGIAEMLKPEITEPILHKYNMTSMDDLYATIGYGGITASKFLTKVRDLYERTNKTAKDKDAAVAGMTTAVAQDSEAAKRAEKAKAAKHSKGIIVAGLPGCLVNISKCCSPIPGDPIMGYITRGRGVSVHRADCKSRPSSELEPERYVEVQWVMEDDIVYNVGLSVEANDRNGLLYDISEVIKEEKIQFNSINAGRVKKGLVTIQMGVGIKNATDLDRLIRKLRKVDSVYEVKRGKD